MRTFLKYFFGTLDKDFVKSLLAGRTVDEATEQVLAGIVAGVRGNRPDDWKLTAADVGAIMDCQRRRENGVNPPV